MCLCCTESFIPAIIWPTTCVSWDWLFSCSIDEEANGVWCVFECGPDIRWRISDGRPTIGWLRTAPCTEGTIDWTIGVEFGICGLCECKCGGSWWPMCCMTLWGIPGTGAVWNELWAEFIEETWDIWAFWDPCTCGTICWTVDAWGMWWRRELKALPWATPAWSSDTNGFCSTAQKT